jgi:mRNA interferase MazF
VVTVAPPGECGKPRHALVIQSDFFADHSSVTLCLLTSDFRDAPLFRLTIGPTAEHGLRQPSQIMVDKILTVARERVGGVIGHLDAETILAVERALALWVGLA